MTCIDAFKNLNIVTQGNSLNISPCCFSNPKPATTIDFINDPYLAEVRMQWNSGVYPDACRECKKSEDSNIASRRQGSNQWYADHGYNNNTVELIRLDYWVGDLCNLRCAICSPHNSSAWKEELKHPVKTVSVNRLWQKLDLSKLKFVHFNGGEPL